jgi:S-adenosylmethionine synthetase
MGFVFSSESVTEGHPDKVADRISDAVLDAYLRADPNARVACETLVATEFICLAGEITADADAVDVEAIARRALRDIGYTDAEVGIGCDTAQALLRIVEQSPDIAQGTAARDDGMVGAGDQGLMFGYAEQSETHDPKHDYMPVPISLAHRLSRQLSKVRRGKLPYLRPDGKSQVSVRYEEGRPVGIDALVLAAQHDPDVPLADLQADLHEHVVAPIVPEEWLHDETRFFINHTGKFVKGGPAADTGLTGRKIIVDTYGGWVPHGGGAFSGKDPTKVDRSAAYFARYAAKNMVAAGLADRMQIQVAYSIGSLDPVSLNVQTFGTGQMPEDELEAVLRSDYDFGPGAIIDHLRLRRPIYAATSAYGHFGRSDVELPWERRDHT